MKSVMVRAWLALVLAVGVGCGHEAPQAPQAKQSAAGATAPERASGPTTVKADTQRAALESGSGTSSSGTTASATTAAASTVTEADGG
ncbi:hypothetical protein, partial [Archangium sp.]|uniref:hypothetical protein n=1 Tax=Archangium sp. TaxID=1872627 RepID=UPI002EDA2E6C